MKPSERIYEIYMGREENKDTDINNFIQAILDYLDENENQKTKPEEVNKGS